MGATSFALAEQDFDMMHEQIRPGMPSVMLQEVGQSEAKNRGPVTDNTEINNKIKTLIEERDQKIKSIVDEYEAKLKDLLGDNVMLPVHMFGAYTNGSLKRSDNSSSNPIVRGERLVNDFRMMTNSSTTSSSIKAFEPRVRSMGDFFKESIPFFQRFFGGNYRLSFH